MLLTVLAIWSGLAVLAAVFVAALGRSALREDQALDAAAWREDYETAGVGRR